MTTDPLSKQWRSVVGQRMAYHESGSGSRTLVFLHGNPTSSYLWRNIIPHVSGLARCVAPDLIGHGDSAKIDDSGPGSYTVAEHLTYLDALLEALDIGDDVVLVLHDWGAALGFDWANRNRHRVSGLCYMEAIVCPVDWVDWPEDTQKISTAMRSDAGDELALTQNLFVEVFLPNATMRSLDDAEMAEYRRPFERSGEFRRPTLTWPRQIPVHGEPADVHDMVAEYAVWLSGSNIPKLFVNAEPGAVLVGPHREFCRSWPNQTEVTVAGLHFIQEDHPDEIGDALRTWLEGL